MAPPRAPAARLATPTPAPLPRVSTRSSPGGAAGAPTLPALPPPARAPTQTPTGAPSPQQVQRRQVTAALGRLGDVPEEEEPDVDNAGGGEQEEGQASDGCVVSAQWGCVVRHCTRLTCPLGQRCVGLRRRGGGWRRPCCRRQPLPLRGRTGHTGGPCPAASGASAGSGGAWRPVTDPVL
jgi:hypothetical protein